MSGFRPRLVPTLVTIAVVGLCLGLGVWQLQRLQWKRALIAERTASLAMPPVAPPATLAGARALEFHPVVAQGVLLNEREFYLNAIGPAGGAGFDLLTPLREGDGRVVFVNRGFVPAELRDPATRLPGPDGIVRITGLLRLPPEARPGWFVPDNQPQRNAWYWIDLPAMAAAARLSADGLTNLAPFYVEADAIANQGGWPKGAAAPPALPNDHLQYALTWFALAAAAAVIYVQSERRAGRDNDASPPI